MTLKVFNLIAVFVGFGCRAIEQLLNKLRVPREGLGLLL
jgi:hypothetical protein